MAESVGQRALRATGKRGAAVAALRDAYVARGIVPGKATVKAAEEVRAALREGRDGG